MRADKPIECENRCNLSSLEIELFFLHQIRLLKKFIKYGDFS